MFDKTILTRLACALGIFAVAAAGCEGLEEHRLEVVGDAGGGVVEEAMPVPGQLDLLLVVDNSNSMCEEQAALANTARELVLGLEAAGADYRIAVVTTDMVDTVRGGGRFAIGPGTFNNVSACSIAVPDTTACAFNGAPWLDSGQLEREALISALQCRVYAGIDGNPVEMGLASAHAALERPEQQTFLRPGSRLALVFVTDENDCSDGTVGGLAGSVYSAVTAGAGDAACEYERNLEDSCLYAKDDYAQIRELGPMLELDGVSQPARVWCTRGDRAAVEALGEALELKCGWGTRCANQLVARATVRDAVLGAVAARNGLARREDAQRFVSVIGVLNLDGGVRYNEDEQVPAWCGVGQQSYRYQAFAEMFDWHRVVPICDLATEQTTAFAGALAAAVLEAVP